MLRITPEWIGRSWLSPTGQHQTSEVSLCFAEHESLLIEKLTELYHILTTSGFNIVITKKLVFWTSHHTYTWFFFHYSRSSFMWKSSFILQYSGFEWKRVSIKCRHSWENNFFKNYFFVSSSIIIPLGVWSFTDIGEL